VGKPVPSTNPVSDRARGSTSVRTWNKNLLSEGYVPGSRGFDALLVGVYENKQFIFAAKVKNGFVPRVRDEIFPALKALRTAKRPFGSVPE
jgi:hypothetical protein